MNKGPFLTSPNLTQTHSPTEEGLFIEVSPTKETLTAADLFSNPAEYQPEDPIFCQLTAAAEKLTASISNPQYEQLVTQYAEHFPNKEAYQRLLKTFILKSLHTEKAFKYQPDSKADFHSNYLKALNGRLQGIHFFLNAIAPKQQDTDLTLYLMEIFWTDIRQYLPIFTISLCRHDFLPADSIFFFELFHTYQALIEYYKKSYHTNIQARLAKDFTRPNAKITLLLKKELFFSFQVLPATLGDCATVLFYLGKTESAQHLLSEMTEKLNFLEKKKNLKKILKISKASRKNANEVITALKDNRTDLIAQLRNEQERPTLREIYDALTPLVSNAACLKERLLEKTEVGEEYVQLTEKIFKQFESLSSENRLLLLPKQIKDLDALLKTIPDNCSKKQAQEIFKKLFQITLTFQKRFDGNQRFLELLIAAKLKTLGNICHHMLKELSLLIKEQKFEPRDLPSSALENEHAAQPAALANGHFTAQHELMPANGAHLKVEKTVLSNDSSPTNLPQANGWSEEVKPMEKVTADTAALGMNTSPTPPSSQKKNKKNARRKAQKKAATSASTVSANSAPQDTPVLAAPQPSLGENPILEKMTLQIVSNEHSSEVSSEVNPSSIQVADKQVSAKSVELPSASPTTTAEVVIPQAVTDNLPNHSASFVAPKHELEKPVEKKPAFTQQKSHSSNGLAGSVIPSKKKSAVEISLPKNGSSTSVSNPKKTSRKGRKKMTSKNPNPLMVRSQEITPNSTTSAHPSSSNLSPRIAPIIAEENFVEQSAIISPTPINVRLQQEIEEELAKLSLATLTELTEKELSASIEIITLSSEKKATAMQIDLFMDASLTDAPLTDTSLTDAPLTDAPLTDAPLTDAPLTDAPLTDAPLTDAPLTDAPLTDAPLTDASHTTNASPPLENSSVYSIAQPFIAFPQFEPVDPSIRKAEVIYASFCLLEQCKIGFCYLDPRHENSQLLRQQIHDLSHEPWQTYGEFIVALFTHANAIDNLNVLSHLDLIPDLFLLSRPWNAYYYFFQQEILLINCVHSYKFYRLMALFLLPEILQELVINIGSGLNAEINKTLQNFITKYKGAFPEAEKVCFVAKTSQFLKTYYEKLYCSGAYYCYDPSIEPSLNSAPIQATAISHESFTSNGYLPGWSTQQQRHKETSDHPRKTSRQFKHRNTVEHSHHRKQYRK